MRPLGWSSLFVLFLSQLACCLYAGPSQYIGSGGVWGGLFFPFVICSVGGLCMSLYASHLGQAIRQVESEGRAASQREGELSSERF